VAEAARVVIEIGLPYASRASAIGEALVAVEPSVSGAAFVDGSHIFHTVFVDPYFLQEFVCPCYLVVVGHSQWPSVTSAVSYLDINAGWQPHQVEDRTRFPLGHTSEAGNRLRQATESGAQEPGRLE
jgi:hypothetical protein